MGFTIAEKILRNHIVDGEPIKGAEVGIKIDQTLTQDATGTMAYLEFEAMGVDRVKTERSVAYIDHNTLQSGFENADDHKYLQTVAKKHGVLFSRPGNGICHQVHLERFGIPGKTLIEISKILSGEVESPVNISYTNNHIVFEFDNTIVVSRLIEGEYFKIDQMLSSDYETKLKINKKELLNCIDRATLLIKEGDKKPIIINIQDGVMELKIKSQIGSMNEEIEIEKEGKDLLIGFNPKFLIDALRVIDDEEVTLYLMNAKAPCFIRDDEESYIYLILPVNFNAVS